MTKTIDTLIEDIDELFTDAHTEVTEAHVETFGENVKKLLKESIETSGVDRDFTIRMSNLGTPLRKLYYEQKASTEEATAVKTKISPATYRKFLFGHILEELLLFLTKEAGHKVSAEQKEVEIDGVLGHMDCKIDGKVTDIKSASTFGFGKFKNGSLVHDDTFGYIMQISSYTWAEDQDEGYFFAIDKQHGELALLRIDGIDLKNPEDRIEEVRETLKGDSPPSDKCYPPKVEKNGNEELNTSCYYCPHKYECWADANGGKGLRWFKYSNKNKALVKVVKEPRVDEIKTASQIIEEAKEEVNG